MGTDYNSGKEGSPSPLWWGHKTGHDSPLESDRRNWFPAPLAPHLPRAELMRPSSGEWAQILPRGKRHSGPTLDRGSAFWLRHKVGKKKMARLAGIREGAMRTERVGPPLPFSPFILSHSAEVLAKQWGLLITRGLSWFGGLGRYLKERVATHSSER